MKKILFFGMVLVALATVSIGFTSCSKDDDKGADAKVLIGKWRDTGVLEFKSDGTFQYAVQGLTSSGTYKVVRTAYLRDWGGSLQGKGEPATSFDIELTTNREAVLWIAYYVDRSEEYGQDNFSLYVYLVEDGKKKGEIGSFTKDK
jgi:hypothetical protein